jgi:hypothetical protein
MKKSQNMKVQLSKQNGFGPTFFPIFSTQFSSSVATGKLFFLILKRQSKRLTHAREECNKLYLTPSPVSF